MLSIFPLHSSDCITLRFCLPIHIQISNTKSAKQWNFGNLCLNNQIRCDLFFVCFGETCKEETRNELSKTGLHASYLWHWYDFQCVVHWGSLFFIAFFHVLWLSACDLLKLVFFFLRLFIQIEMLWVEFWILAAYKMNQKLITRFAGMSRFSKCWCLDRLVFALRTSIDRRLVDFVFVSSPVKVIFYCCGPMDTLVLKRFSYFRRVVDLNIFFSDMHRQHLFLSHR